MEQRRRLREAGRRSLPSPASWAVIPAEGGLASNAAYPSILGYPWVVKQMTPIIDKAVAGQGGAK